MKISVFCRRFLCCLLVCLLLIPAALADVPDLSKLTNDEIVELLGKVNEELVSRGISKTAKLPQGTYSCSQDIPAGRYIFTCLATGDDWGNLFVYDENGKQVEWQVVVAPKNGEDPQTAFITLQEGYKIKCSTPFSLTIMAGTIFQ